MTQVIRPSSWFQPSALPLRRCRRALLFPLPSPSPRLRPPPFPFPSRRLSPSLSPTPVALFSRQPLAKHGGPCSRIVPAGGGYTHTRRALLTAQQDGAHAGCCDTPLRTHVASGTHLGALQCCSCSFPMGAGGLQRDAMLHWSSPDLVLVAPAFGPRRPSAWACQQRPRSRYACPLSHSQRASRNWRRHAPGGRLVPLSLPSTS